MDDQLGRVVSEPAAPPGEQPMTVNEFAALHRVVPLTVRRWIRDEGLPVRQRRKGTKILIYPSEVAAWSLEVWGHEFRCIGAPPGKTVTADLEQAATLADGDEVTA